MGLYQNAPRGNIVDFTLTVEDITGGRDISDTALFNDVMAAPAQMPTTRRSHIDNVSFRRRLDDDDDSDAAILRSCFEDKVPTRPYGGRRSQWD
jgi:hypothetical protein